MKKSKDLFYIDSRLYRIEIRQWYLNMGVLLYSDFENSFKNPEELKFYWEFYLDEINKYFFSSFESEWDDEQYLKNYK